MFLSCWGLSPLVFSSVSANFRDSETTTKIKFAVFFLGEDRPKCFFRGRRHDNKSSMKVQTVLSSNFVVIAQAPTSAQGLQSSGTAEMWKGSESHGS